MRRIITTAVLGLTLLGGASACSGTADPATPGASPSTAATSAAAAGGTADKATTCAAVKKLQDETSAKAVTAIGSLMASTGDEAKAMAAKDELLKLAADSSVEAEKIAANAADPEVKAALTEYAAEWKTLGDKVKAAGTDFKTVTEAFVQSKAKLPTLCA